MKQKAEKLLYCCKILQYLIHLHHTMGENPCFMSTFPPDKDLPSQQKQDNGINKKTVIVVRHGERLDYVTRDRGENWIPTSNRPWDPPLTTTGLQQAKSLESALPEILQNLGLSPNLSAVYSSPFYRCIQTASGLSSSSLLLLHKKSK